MENRNELLETFVEVKLPSEDNFLIVKETLSRIGISSKRDNTLFQSCHILHKKGRYYIVHFKELFALDGKETDFSETDRIRRNRIANLLEEWELVEIVSKDNAAIPEDLEFMPRLKVVSKRDSENWNLVPKYNIGVKRGYYAGDDDLEDTE